MNTFYLCRTTLKSKPQNVVLIRMQQSKYSTRLRLHPNELAVTLLDTDGDTRRLKRFKPNDLSTRF